MNVEEEEERLKEEIQRLGKVQPDGSYKILEGFLTILKPLLVLFNDDRCAHTYLKHRHIFEALVGTLGEAKMSKVLSYEGELLLQGVHDNVEVILKPAPLPASGAATASVVRN
ncbi:hypothetical protein POTOM_054704 [Populus tomentosa]|uniref:Costars domain-containing protein n=1 Tax=Populus tomentosa TaxID=118781 RepID=A0A8X8C6K2_POPTO|nr:hypothetical protein POTOM_054704 [Populus tomentosa]